MPQEAITPRRLLAAACVVAVLGTGAIVLFLNEPTQTRFFPKCILRETTGLNCPGCGSTRALHQLLHGRVTAAMHYNVLLVVSLPVLAYAMARRGLGWFNVRIPPYRPLRSGLIWGLFVLVVAYFILRNVPIAPFTLLAPHAPGGG